MWHKQIDGTRNLLGQDIAFLIYYGHVIIKSMAEPYPSPQNRAENMRPAQAQLLRPMACVDLLNIPVYDIKIIEESFDMPEKNLKKVELHPREWDAMMLISDGKSKEGKGIPITNLISSDLVAETKGIFKKEERLIEIIYNADNRENTIRIKLDDKDVEEFLKSIEILKQNSSDSVYWTYRSLSFQTEAGHRTTVDIYPLAPFLAEGEELVWYSAGIVKKRIVSLQALTNYRVYHYDYLQHAGVVVLIPGLQDVVVMNQKRASNSTSIGTYAMSRYNITGFRNNRTTSLTIGDVQFIAEGKPYIIFGQVGDPNGLARLVKSLKHQQAHVQIGGPQVQIQSELVQSEIKETQTAPERGKAGITCIQCNNSNPHGAQFCNMCGSKLQPGCSKCGSINPEQSKFCNKCGFALA